MKVDSCVLRAVTLAVVILIVPLPGFSQQSDSTASSTSSAVPATQTDAPPSKSGYTHADHLEGGDSVTLDLAQDDVKVGAAFNVQSIQNFFKPWFDGKKKLNEKHGLKLNFSYQALYQQDDTDLDPDEGAAGRGQFQGTWALIGRNTKNPGLLSFRVENRHAYGSKIPPTQLGSTFGAVLPTGAGFSDFGTAVTEVAWRQTLLDGRMKFVFGKISATSWYNAYALSSPMRGFQNIALQSSASKAAPGRGIGGGAAVRLGDRWVALAGIHDANARTPDDPFDTIDEGEFFQSLEVRWFPTSFDRRLYDQVRVQVWHQDERTEAGIPSDQGFTFAASRLFNNFWMPFILGGMSDGAATTYEKDLIAGVGFGFKPVHRTARDVLGFAVGWGSPAGDTLQDQYTSELFYRLQLVPNLAVTPSVQYIVDPADNPDKTEVWLVGLRGRLTF